MDVITDQAQDEYWRRARYRESDDPVALAYATPKIRHIAQIVDLNQARILDVGCGNGVFTSLFSEFSPHVVGLDYSDHMVRRNPCGKVLRGQAEALPFGTNSFDVAFVANVLHHTLDPQQVVDELARVARGHVVIVEPNRLNPVMFLFSLLIREERGGLRSSKGFLEKLLMSCGLQVLRCSAMGMISQNNTPAWTVPLLRVFDREIWCGEYLIAIAKQPELRRSTQ